jgi:hypothetical protein
MAIETAREGAQSAGEDMGEVCDGTGMVERTGGRTAQGSAVGIE